MDGLRYFGIITVSGPLVAPVMLLLLQTGDKSSMRKGLDYDYDEQNIYVVICDSNIP